MAYKKYTVTDADTRPAGVTVGSGSSTTGAVEITIDTTKVTDKRQIVDALETAKQFVMANDYPA